MKDLYQNIFQYENLIFISITWWFFFLMVLNISVFH